MSDNSEQLNLNNPQEHEIKKADSEENYMVLGMCIGMSLGISIGQIVFNNLAVGLSVGLSVGMTVGLSIKKISKPE